MRLDLEGRTRSGRAGVCSCLWKAVGGNGRILPSGEDVGSMREHVDEGDRVAGGTLVSIGGMLILLPERIWSPSRGTGDFGAASPGVDGRLWMMDLPLKKDETWVRRFAMRSLLDCVDCGLERKRGSSMVNPNELASLGSGGRQTPIALGITEDPRWMNVSDDEPPQ